MVGGSVFETMERAFGPTPADAADARAFIRWVLGHWGVRARDDAALVGGELATNAYRHAGTGFTVRLRWFPDAVRIEVRDASTAPPRPLEAAPLATGGRGLAIVECLATSWGWDVDEGGKTVWAELPLDSAPAATVA